MDKFMRVTHVLPTTDKILSTGWRREGMIACGADKKNTAEVFLVDFTKVGVLNPEDASDVAQPYVRALRNKPDENP